MTGFETILLFLLALVTVYLTPGPDMALILTISSSRGKGAGIQTAAGFAAARAVHVFVSGMGLSALFSRFPIAYTSVRLVGAGYLLFVARSLLRSGAESESTEQNSLNRDSLKQGFITNLLNPKALIFCSILLPQFLFSERHSLFFQFFILGSILVATGFIFDAAYSFIAGSTARYVSNRGMQRFRKYGAPLIFILIALYLLVTLFLEQILP